MPKVKPKLLIAQAAFLTPLVLFLDQKDVRIECYLRRFGLSKALLLQGDVLISKNYHVWNLLECIVSHEGFDDLGFQLGLADMFACKGPLALSLEGSKTFFEALNGAMIALTAYIQDERVEFRSEGDVTHIDFVREQPGVCPITDQIAVRYACLLLGLRSSECPLDYSVSLRSKEPRGRWSAETLPVRNFEFDAPVTRISIPSKVLAERIVFPPINFQQSVFPQSIPETHSLADSMRSVVADLMKSGAPPPNVFEAASFIQMDRKTLYRSLAAEGTSYSRIIQESRYEIAAGLLKNTDLPISEVSERLHFGNPNNFSRAFRAKSGLSPKRFRSLHQVN